MEVQVSRQREAARLACGWRFDGCGGLEAREALEGLLGSARASFAPRAREVHGMHLDRRGRIEWASYSYVGPIVGKLVTEIAQCPQSITLALLRVRETREPTEYVSDGEHGAWRVCVSPRFRCGHFIGYETESIPVTSVRDPQ